MIITLRFGIVFTFCSTGSVVSHPASRFVLYRGGIFVLYGLFRTGARLIRLRAC